MRYLSAWLLFLTLAMEPTPAQPVFGKRWLLEGFQVFADLTQTTLYYYAPGDLDLVRDAMGKPDFQLVQMRYTGASAYGDAGEKRFRNLLQFTVALPGMTAAQAEAIRMGLPAGKSAALRPLPIRRIESVLVIPMGENAERRYERIGAGGAFEAVSGAGDSQRDAYWTQRTFSLRLDNHEAQLLWTQIEKGQLALSLNYSFFADGILEGEGTIMASGALKPAQHTLPQLTRDTTLHTVPVKSNALPILVDPEKWPDLLRKIDINEDIPPAYAALEIRCYDFAEQLRPDLFRKSVEIRATGVGGQMINQRADFSVARPDQAARSIRFPFAVKMSQPWQYRVEEIDSEGNRKPGPWVVQKSWVDLLDVTTPEAQNQFEQRLIDIEFDTEGFAAAGAVQAWAEIRYVFRGTGQKMLLPLDPRAPYVTVTLRLDKEHPVRVRSLTDQGDGQLKAGPESVCLDAYVFVSPP